MHLGKGNCEKFKQAKKQTKDSKELAKVTEYFSKTYKSDFEK